MQGKVLIVDAIATNRIVLKVKLAAAYYQVLQSEGLDQAVAVTCAELPDLVICALTLPDGSAADLCRRLKTDPATEHIPIMAIGCRPHADSRLAALEAGVHDVLLKPLDDALLLGRARSLIRAHNAAAEWQMRDDTSRALGLAEPSTAYAQQGECVLIHPDTAAGLGWASQLRPLLQARLTLAKPTEAIRDEQSKAPPDIYVLALPRDSGGANASLRLISTLRANASTRHAGLLVLQTQPDAALAATALDLGADDLMTDGFDAAELALRLHALLRRKRMADQLRATVRTGLKAAVFDPLTGLHNRRYAMPHLQRIAERAQDTARPFAVMLADLDHFKRINDIHGHAAGDAVLVETAKRLRNNLRGTDLVARIGGEEFLIVMPGTSLQEAQAAAVRLCNDIGNHPFNLPTAATPISVTISIGMAIGPADATSGASLSERRCPRETVESLLDRVDKALYSAKNHGRNQVTLSRPAA